MRQIRFRGKNLKFKTWAYGYYIQIGNTHWIAESDVEFKVEGSLVEGRLEGPRIDPDPTNGIYGFAQVDPATVGQFTGLHDKNGVEIYEGSIVKHKFKYVIEYKNGSFGYHDTVGQWLPLCTWKDLCFLEVIGNIHSNPELIEK